MSDNFKFNSLAPAYGQLKEHGIALQKQGVALVRIAESGIANIAPLDNLVTTCLGISDTHPEVKPVVQSLLGSGINSFAQLGNANAGLAAALPSVDLSVLAATYATSSNNVAAGTLVETIFGLVPECKDLVVHAWPASGLTRSFTDDELDAYLEKFDRDLPRRRQGAWQTYYSVSSDAVAQASHSMRDILAKIIAREAANDKIENCSWYKERRLRDPDTRLSIKDRVRFLLFGPNEQGFDQTKMSEIENAVSLYVNDDGTLKKIAHGSSNFSKDEARVSMQNVEELLYLILKRLYKIG